MNGFLAKPLQPADLAGLITATVEHHTPAAAPPAGDQPASAQLAHQPPATRTVLYIDDNAALRGLAERILSKDPAITVLTAADADTGLAQAAAHQPDLILLDLHLHGSHGEALISSLRSGERTSTIPVIAVSGDTSPATVKRLTSLGVTAYLSKPFDAERLRAIVTATATQRPTGTAAAPGPA
jgi:DNA-binding response OmpR family regulator